MVGISLQKKIFYGPVFSRRFGRSYGINLLPTHYKLCNFDCVYCEYGKRIYQNQPSRFLNDDLPSVHEVIETLDKALRKPRSIQSLTFSGNGEPTLHPDFSEIAIEVRKLRDYLCPDAQLVLLSNASGLLNPDVFKAISLFDSPMMKLDAGNEETFIQINHPDENIHLQDILDELKRLPRLMIQCMIVDGQFANCRGKAYDEWIRALRDLNPEKVQIYSADRPFDCKRITPVSPQKLQLIQKNIQQKTDLDVEAFFIDSSRKDIRKKSLEKN